MKRLIVSIAALTLMGACDSGSAADDQTTTSQGATTTVDPNPTTTRVAPAEPMTLVSRSFADGAEIPSKYTCDGENISPSLEIGNIPPEAVSLVLIVEDPDAPVGIWHHWVEYDIEVTGQDMLIPENSGIIAIQGVNSWNLVGYGGPCPPPGQTHRYVFTVYAADELLLIPGGSETLAVRSAMDGHVIAEASTTGTYGR